MPAATTLRPRTPPVYRDVESSATDSTHVHPGDLQQRYGGIGIGCPTSKESTESLPPPKRNFGMGLHPSNGSPTKILHPPPSTPRMLPPSSALSPKKHIGSSNTRATASPCRKGTVSPSTASPNKYPLHECTPKKQMTPIVQESPKSKLQETKQDLPPLKRINGHESEPVPGYDYFTIGDIVRIRRYNKEKKAYSRWVTGTILMPFFHPRGVEVDGQPRQRAYEVEYTDPVKKTIKRGSFNPLLGEIEEIRGDGVEFLDSNLKVKSVVYGLLEHPYQSRTAYISFRRIWTPCLLLSSSAKGKKVRALAGHAKGVEFNILRTKAYCPEVASELKARGEEVVGDGREDFRSECI